jgi:hypothetical protein
MSAKRWIQALFILSALYDAALGLIFLAIPERVFNTFGVELPNHLGYVHFPALLLLVFAVMLIAVAVKPVHNRNLIPYAILFKLAYSLVVIGHWLTAGVPWMWQPFAIIDLVMAGLFLWAYLKLCDPDFEEEIWEE